MQKIVRIGTIKYGNKWSSVYFKVTDERNYLSFTGVIGPRPSGNSDGGCGQIVMEFAHRDATQNDNRYPKLIHPEDVKFAEGWDKQKLLDFIDAWEKWHMKKDISPEVFKFIDALPKADKIPAWC